MDAMNQSSPQSAPTPKFTLIAAISILLLLGMVSGAALWIMAAIAVGLLIAVNFFLTKTWSTATVASRQGGDKELTAGSTHEVVITVTNQSKLPVLWLLVEDLLPAKTMSYDPTRLHVSGDRIRLLMMWGQATRKLKYQIGCNRRGYFQVGPTILETGDMMGLYRRYRAGNQPQYVTVLPRVVPLTTYEIGSRRPIGEIRMRESIMDDPTRLRGIRQWEPGDPMRSVHWSATARTGTLHSKVYEPSSIIGATLIMDLHQRTTPQRHEPVRSDLAITAAASIATALHESNEPVGIATNARDAADRIRQEGWQGDHRVRGLAQAAASMLDESERLRPKIGRAHV